MKLIFFRTNERNASRVENKMDDKHSEEEQQNLVSSFVSFPFELIMNNFLAQWNGKCRRYQSIENVCFSLEASSEGEKTIVKYEENNDFLACIISYLCW